MYEIISKKRNEILNQKHPGYKKVAAKNWTKKRLGVKRCEIKIGGQGQWSVTADGNKILIITIQAAKH